MQLFYSLFKNKFQQKRVSYRNQSIELDRKSLDKFLYEKGFYGKALLSRILRFSFNYY